MNQEDVKPEDHGLEVGKANELTSGLSVAKAERELLIEEFQTVSILEVTKENLPVFKELRLKIVKNRTQGINKWHKANKEFFLTGGKFVDAIKNKENGINEAMENKLMDAEKYFENLEKEKLIALQFEREVILFQYVENAGERNLSGMEDKVWQAYLASEKKEYENKVAAEKQAEIDRLAVIEADKKDRLRIEAENEQLRKEAVEREKVAKIELDKRKKLEAQVEASAKAEREALAKEEARIQSELSKGDEAKLTDFTDKLVKLKSEYSFESEVHKRKYSDACKLIDKIINYIK